MRVRVHALTATAVFAVALLLSVRPVVAATADLTLDCYPVGTGAGDATYTLQTDMDSSPNLKAWGGAFSGTADQELQCQFVVPADYYENSTTEPSVRLVGYAKDCVGCIGGACSTTRKVKFKVSSKALSPGYGIFLSWSAEGSDEESYTSVSCGATCVTTTCYQDDEVRQFTADAINDASGWIPGDTVIIRVQRDTTVTDNLTSAFVVNGFRLTYPLD